MVVASKVKVYSTTSVYSFLRRRIPVCFGHFDRPRFRLVFFRPNLRVRRIRGKALPSSTRIWWSRDKSESPDPTSSSSISSSWTRPIRSRCLCVHVCPFTSRVYGRACARLYFVYVCVRVCLCKCLCVYLSERAFECTCRCLGVSVPGYFDI